MFKHCPCLFLTNNTIKSMDYEETFFEPVILNVYDLFKINDFAENLGLGVYHTGVEIYGKEYGYGGHPYDFSGIFTIPPKDVEELSEFFNVTSDKIHLKETIVIGYTSLSRSDVKRLIYKKLEPKFKGRKYHLLSHNCNHFASMFTKMLCHKDIPSWINRLATIGTYLPFIHKCLPLEWLSPFDGCNNKRS